MISRLNLIAKKAVDCREEIFTSLMHHFNEVNLTECFHQLRKNSAPGVDKRTVAEYGENLSENIQNLIQRMKDRKYRPQPVRRVCIPKSRKKGGLRKLGIPSTKDKIVQALAAKILGYLYRPNFRDTSHGFRPNRSCHAAFKQVNQSLMGNPVN